MISTTMIKNNLKLVVSGIIGLILAFVIGSILFAPPKKEHAPIGTSHGDVVHVHGDFRMYIGDDRIRFTDDKYQSSTEETHHVSLHFHDGNDEVIHRHADGVTLADFFDSLGMTLTNDCLTLDTEKKYCTDNINTLQLLVNGTNVSDVTSYIFAEEDRILVYYGDINNPKLPEYIAGVTDIACMYSGTCPERGTPPTESCGLTCEVADLAATQSENWIHAIKDWWFSR